MKCPQCGNTNIHYFGEIHGRVYCRKCVQFKRVFIDENTNSSAIQKNRQKGVTYEISFDLTNRQKEIADTLIKNYDKRQNTLLLAVCGSGKTEITYPVIAHVLTLGQRVCFALPRRALCVELYQRISAAFKNVEIGCLYGGHKINEKAPLIICTAHQLYRYTQKPFALILMDEADAYPFYGDKVLNAIFESCYTDCFIKMSATLTAKDIHDEAVLVMNRRYHGHDLPVPVTLRLPKPLWIPYLKIAIRKMRASGQKVLLYVPRVEDLDHYMKRLTGFHTAGVSSSTPNINDYIDQLRNNELDALLTTTILERGITIDNVQAIVINSAHPIYDERTLTQIAGRVGRKPDHYTGKVIFLDKVISKEMTACISFIRKLNEISA